MSKTVRRGAVATLGAAALAFTLAPMASAEVIDSDDNVIIQPVEGPYVYRIADRDRIATAIEASQSRTDWGNLTPGNLYWECDGVDVVDLDGNIVMPGRGWVAGDQVLIPIPGTDPAQYVPCTATQGAPNGGTLDIIVARSDDYSDALAATPLADVLDAPVLINPTAALDPRNAAEIERLAASAPANAQVTVHLLGGTNALSHAVENAIDDLDGVDDTLRYQGIDRYETAVNLGWVTVVAYEIESGADIYNVNTYITTGINFPDALAAGAAAAENDGIVLLTKGEQMDPRGFTEDFLTDLNDWVDEDHWNINTNENFAVGGPSHRAAVAADIRLAAAYDGATRYETAALTAAGTFDDPANFAVVSGTTYADALVASAYIANLDGPLLLSYPDRLHPATAAYLSANVDGGDRVFTFGGTGALQPAVTKQIADLFVF